MGDRQDADGQAHLTFYDKDSEMSFVWDGKRPCIQVSQGGYGEPVLTEIEVPDRLLKQNLVIAHLWWFQDVCEAWLHRREMNT